MSSQSTSWGASALPPLLSHSLISQQRGRYQSCRSALLRGFPAGVSNDTGGGPGQHHPPTPVPGHRISALRAPTRNTPSGQDVQKHFISKLNSILHHTKNIFGFSSPSTALELLGQCNRETPMPASPAQGIYQSQALL